MSDVVERLRYIVRYDTPDYEREACLKAANEIERLRAALRGIETKSRGWERGTSAEINKIAKEALDE